MKEDEGTKGIKIGTDGVSLTAHADDITFFILNVRYLKIIIDSCKTFHAFSFLNLNETKSEAVWLGIAKHSKEMLTDCNWIHLVNDKLKLLRLYYSYDQRLINEYNFFNTIKSTKDRLNVWNTRGLTFAGNITLFKSIELSKIL